MTETTIRAFEMADREEVAELFLAPRCCWGTLQLPFQSRDGIRKKLETPARELHRLVALREGKVVGMIALGPYRGRRAHAADIGMFVHDEHQNRGIGSELLQAAIELGERWLGLRRLELTVYTDNAPAIRLYEKHGFVIEGTHRAYALREGEYVDSHAMARTREG